MELHARLVHAEAGRRVVQVSARLGERPLGSALGEGGTAEEAEDRATARLLQRLHGEPPGAAGARVAHAAPPAMTPPATPPPAAGVPADGGERVLRRPAAEAPTAGALSARVPRPSPAREAPSPPAAPLPPHEPPASRGAAPVSAGATAPAASLPTGVSRPEPTPQRRQADATVSGSPRPQAAGAEAALGDPWSAPAVAGPSPGVPPRSDPAHPAEPAEPADPEEEPPADPEDWSQELAALELHMRRLGWGRDAEGIYLQRAFGHPSRSRLTRYSDLRAYLMAVEGLERGSDPAVASVPLRRGELLAQGDALLGQLGWSSAQGQAFLERELQRRSRRELSDVQLLQFNMLLEGELLSAGTLSPALPGESRGRDHGGDA